MASPFEPRPDSALGNPGIVLPDAEIAWLDTAMRRSDRSALSYFARNPVAVLEQQADRPAEFRIGGRVVDSDQSSLTLLRRVQGRLGGSTVAGPGWFGYFGYELAAQLERVPTHSAAHGLPTVRLAMYDTVTSINDQSENAAIHAPQVRRLLGLPPKESNHGGEFVPIELSGGAAQWSSSATRIIPETPRAQFESWVRRAKVYIAAGDIYQVNLAHRLRLEGINDPLAAYAAIRAHNPAPYGALFRFGDAAVLSASPELFLQVRGRDVLTSPIKGTRARGAALESARAAQAELTASEKDAAELAMIVDLHRNDLSRVCEAGSVSVVAPRRFETHPRVVHTVADIAGRLAPGRDALDLVAACFPAGSISGVPKIRALQIIHELEPAPRGVYTGAIGHLGLNGDLTLSVAIRTIQWRAGVAWLHVGSGIVAESDPAAEYDETMAKARGLLEALGCDGHIHST